MLTSPALCPSNTTIKVRPLGPTSPVLTVANFWNCGCPNRFVHSKLEPFCLVCGCCQHEQPDSLANEVTGQSIPPQGLPRTVTSYGILLAYAGQGLYPYTCKSADKHPRAAIYFNHARCAWASEYTPGFITRNSQFDTV